MWSNLVELGPKGIEALLLAAQARSDVPSNPIFECSMHSLVNAVLIRPAGRDARKTRSNPVLAVAMCVEAIASMANT